MIATWLDPVPQILMAWCHPSSARIEELQHDGLVEHLQPLAPPERAMNCLMHVLILCLSTVVKKRKAIGIDDAAICEANSDQIRVVITILINPVFKKALEDRWTQPKLWNHHRR